MPRDYQDVALALDVCRDLKVPIVPRGGGTSCRHQIHDGMQRQVLHIARLLADQIEP